MRREIPALLVATLALAACGDEIASSDAAAAPTTSTPTGEVASTTTAANDDVAGTTAPPTTDPPVATAPPSSTAVTTSSTTNTATVPTTTDGDTMTTVPEPGRPIDGTGADAAVADLAERLGVTTAEIEIVLVEEVTWPDGSVGCPEPGMMYAQVLVNGSRIVLSHDGVDYEYHEGGRRGLFYCPSDQVTPPTGGAYGDI